MSQGYMIGVPPGGVAFSDINDVVDAHLSAMTMGRIGQRYALVSANLSYRDAAYLFARINKTRGPLLDIPGPTAGVDRLTNRKLLSGVGACTAFNQQIPG